MASDGKSTQRVINPATGKLEKSYDEATDAEVKAAIEASHEAHLSWRNTSFDARARLMRRAAEGLRAGAEGFARLMAVEMGKPIKDGRAEILKCAGTCDFYAENAEQFLANDLVVTEAKRSFIAYRPIGVVLAVMPWNFPFWQVLRFAAPALMAGNGALLKHASNVPGCALAIERVFSEAGFPESLFKTLLVGSKRVDGILEHPRVMAATLTGSTPAGRAIARKAGEMLKKTVLELGGSDPYVVLEDADLESAATICAKSRLINAGQSCIAAKRFIVLESVRARFETLFVERLRAPKMGDPLQEATDIGPLARIDLRDEVHRQVELSIAGGARLLTGGRAPEGPGAYYPPTVLTDVSPGMVAFDEEIFGPVAAIVPARDERQAIDLANRSCFGLGAAVFTRDRARGERIAANELEAGCCFVNDLVRSDPRLPFGGIKESGYGRELSHFGIREFVNIKTVYIQ